MTAAPLFIPDLETLKARLRMLDVSGQEGAAVLDQAIEEVRVLLYDSLDPSRISAILAADFDPAAATPEAIDRLRAANLEYTWVRYLLVQRVPSLFVEFNSSHLRQTWNDNAIVREISPTLHRDMLDRLWQIIQSMLDRLNGTDDAGGNGFAIATIGPATIPPRPFGSILGEDIWPASTVEGTDP